MVTCEPHCDRKQPRPRAAQKKRAQQRQRQETHAEARHTKGERHLETLRSDLEELDRQIRALVDGLDGPEAVLTALEFDQREREIDQLHQKRSALTKAIWVQQQVLRGVYRERAGRMVKACERRLESNGQKAVKIQFRVGPAMTIYAPFYCRRAVRNKRPDRGLFPALILLGIVNHKTPATISDVAEYCSATSSFEEAKKLLATRGIKLSINTVRGIQYYFARQARATLKAASHLPAIDSKGVVDSSKKESFRGKKILVCIDGGRMRIRYRKNEKTKNGRWKYDTKWKEPKLLIVAVIGKDGKMDRTILPIIDATMKGPDAVFELLAGYMKMLGADEASEVVFAADGAKWIWNRVGKLRKTVGIAEENFHEVLDFFHAVEHVATVAKSRKSWSEKQRKSWISDRCAELKRGEIGAVIEAIRSVGKRQGKVMRREAEYFRTNADRMKYAQMAERGLPLGSGLVESAIRRVINLRLKGSSQHWLLANAESMLLLRSWYKSGRWNQLKTLVFTSNSEPIQHPSLP